MMNLEGRSLLRQGDTLPHRSQGSRAGFVIKLFAPVAAQQSSRLALKVHAISEMGLPAGVCFSGYPKFPKCICMENLNHRMDMAINV